MRACSGVLIEVTHKVLSLCSSCLALSVGGAVPGAIEAFRSGAIMPVGTLERIWCYQVAQNMDITENLPENSKTNVQVS